VDTVCGPMYRQIKINNLFGRVPVLRSNVVGKKG
jgi:hypothetical protein